MAILITDYLEDTVKTYPDKIAFVDRLHTIHVL